MDRSEWVLVPMCPPQMALDYLQVPEVGNWHGMLSLMPVPPKEAPPPPAEHVSGEHVEGLPQPFGYIKPRDDLSGYDVFDEPGPGRAAIWNLHGLQAALSQRPVVEKLTMEAAHARGMTLQEMRGWNRAVDALAPQQQGGNGDV